MTRLRRAGLPTAIVGAFAGLLWVVKEWRQYREAERNMEMAMLLRDMREDGYWD